MAALTKRKSSCAVQQAGRHAICFKASIGDAHRCKCMVCREVAQSQAMPGKAVARRLQHSGERAPMKPPGARPDAEASPLSPDVFTACSSRVCSAVWCDALSAQLANAVSEVYSDIRHRAAAGDALFVRANVQHMHGRPHYATHLLHDAGSQATQQSLCSLLHAVQYPRTLLQT